MHNRSVHRVASCSVNKCLYISNICVVSAQTYWFIGQLCFQNDMILLLFNISVTILCLCNGSYVDLSDENA